jgi:hypothetical protein
MKFLPAFYLLLFGIFLAIFGVLTKFVYYERDDGFIREQYWGLPAWYKFETDRKPQRDQAGNMIYYYEQTIIFFPEFYWAICVALVPCLFVVIVRKFWLNEIRFRLGTLVILSFAALVCVHGNIYLVFPDNPIAPGWPIVNGFPSKIHKIMGNGAVGLCILFAAFLIGEFLFPVDKSNGKALE